MKKYIFCVTTLLFLGLQFSCKNDSLSAEENTRIAVDTLPEVSLPSPVIDSHPLFPDFILPDSLEKKMDPLHLWPIEVAPILPGAILPRQRILAFYGNLYSKGMGILGELPKEQMMAKLRQEVKNWQAADTSRPVKPALHLVAITAQSKPGAGAMYRLRMPDKLIDTVIAWAAELDALVFLDVQVGHSTLQQELPHLEKYLRMPQVHLGIDPEFSMKTGHAPGKKVGVYDATDINYAADYLEGLVKLYGLPPKVLVVHRFKTHMVTNYKNIKKRSEVQIVMDMDGFGAPELKKSTQYWCIYKEPVEYTGFKIFYKNDFRGNGRLMTPEEVLNLYPPPIYIQYQ